MSDRDAHLLVPRPPRAVIGLHEAGHFLGSVKLLNIVPGGLSIHRTDAFLGVCVLPDAPPIDFHRHDPARPWAVDPALRREVERRIVFDLAGSAAERLQRFLPTGWRVDDETPAACEVRASAMAASLERFAPRDRDLLRDVEAMRVDHRETAPDDAEAADLAVRLAGAAGGALLIFQGAVADQFAHRYAAPILAIADALRERTVLSGDDALAIVRGEEATSDRHAVA